MATSPRDRNRLATAPDRQFNASELSKKVMETITKTSENINTVNNDTVKRIADDYKGFANDLLAPMKKHSLKVDSKSLKVENAALSKLTREFENVANDNFGGKSFSILNDIYKETMKQAKLLRNIEKNTGLNIVSKSGNVAESPSVFLEDIEDNTSFLSGLFKTMKYFTAQSLKVMGLQNSRIARLFKVNDEWYDMDRERYEWELKNRVKEKLSFGQRAVRAVKNVFTPDDDNKGIVAKAMRGTAAVAGFYGAIGNMTGGLIKNVLTKFGFLGSAAGLKGVLVRATTMLLGFGGLFAGIAALVTGAAFLSIARNPDYLGKYAGAFLRIWQDNIVPAWEYLSDLGSKFMEWWNSGGEDGAASIGDFINEVMIYLIGNVIPNALTIIGTSIKSVITTIGNLVMIPADLVTNIFNGIIEMGARIMGIFGLGKYGDDGFFNNVAGLLKAPGDMLGNIFYDMSMRFQNIYDQLWETWFMITDWVKEMLGITWLKNKIEEVVILLREAIVEKVTGMFNGITGWLGETVVEFKDWLLSFPFFESLVNKVQSMLDAILDYIPRPSSIIKWIKSKIPNWASGFFGDSEEGSGPSGPVIGQSGPDYPVPGYNETFSEPDPSIEPEKSTLDSLKDYGREIKDSMTDSILGIFNSTKDSLTGTSEKIMNKATDKLSQIDTNELYNKASEHMDIAKGAASRATQVIIDNSNNARNNVNQVAASVRTVGGAMVNAGMEKASGFSGRFNSPGGY